MAIIAVAGGGGQVGRTLVEALVDHGHEVYVLTRKVRSQQGRAVLLEADYNDVGTMTELLEAHSIDTLICAIGCVDQEASQCQLNLIRAADQSRCTHRFVISGFDMHFKREHIDISPIAKFTYEAVDALQNTTLEHTRIVCGWFLDYYGMPHWKTSLRPWVNVVCMADRWAVIPGDGNVKATFITCQDMASLFARLMSSPKWEPVSFISGEDMTFDELLSLAEDVRGSKFEVVYDSLEKLDSGMISFAERFPPVGLGSADQDQAFLARVHHLAGSGNYYVASRADDLNHNFPDVKLTTCKELMTKCWRGLGETQA